MAGAFRRTDGDIAAVLQTLFASREFDASLGTRFKDPIHYVVSAVRLTIGDQVVTNPRPMHGWLRRMNEALYANLPQAPLADSTRAVLGQAQTPQEWNTLYLSSPEFMHR